MDRLNGLLGKSEIASAHIASTSSTRHGKSAERGWATSRDSAEPSSPSTEWEQESVSWGSPRDGRQTVHGFTTQAVCARRGQARSRSTFSTCGAQYVVTGSAPDRVLEAGHLFSYAQLGSHHAHGGLLLRRDIRRLFDDGLLAANPGALDGYLAPDLAIHAHYAALHGTRWAAMPMTSRRNGSLGTGTSTGLPLRPLGRSQHETGQLLLRRRQQVPDPSESARIR